ncbi:hypothetical protein RLIN73S_04637 [Rhodanobacter lindaniclasticus]
MKSLITPSERPSVAITNENSPICAMPSPARSAVRGSCPTTSTPRLQASVLPTITTPAISNAGTAYCHNIAGSIFKPIATKNSAANMSRNGSTRCTTRPALRDSATTAPARNAPSATLKPIHTATRLAPKQIPSTLTSKVSSRPKPAT